MSDRYTARLEIGGNVPKDLLDDLAQLLYEQGQGLLHTGLSPSKIGVKYELKFLSRCLYLQ